ncbi:MAG: nucleotide exchange factor GrpE [Candidatus Blackburnbacteria bacterium]|nr:nucleotide exchange factor GrpE [Candidatus Blackburnbacteria bacterium]
MAREVKKGKRDLELQLARALADYDNLVKRASKEREEVVLRATKGFVEDLLPVVDSLERAQEHLKDKGFEMALSSLGQVLRNHGVEEIAVSTGNKFDAGIHEAGAVVNGGKDGTIAGVLAKGYRWKDGTVLRPVKVQVYGEKPEKEDEIERELERGDYA